MAVNPEKAFKNLLRELFQLDNTDLDFGIYRILNLRSKDVEKFINEILPNKLKSLRDKLSERSAKELMDELNEVKNELEDGFEVDFTNEKDLLEKNKQFGKSKAFKKPYQLYLELKDSLDDAQLSDDFEKDVYNELFRFFRRYYEGGDFISMPRSGENSYMIPYNGEEVKLYWANHDQYYIKTGENFKNYVFTNGKNEKDLVTVEFRVKDADTPMNNNQDEKKRRFVPTENYYKWNEGKQTLEIWFEYKIPSKIEQKKWGKSQDVQTDNKGINQKLILALKKDVPKTKYTGLVQLWDKSKKDSKNKDIPLFAYHLKRFTSINSFDFFIHKNLGKFLKKELDYFIKNEVLSLNFCNTELTEAEIEKAIQQNTLKATAIHDIAHTIIEFLNELEEFQRHLFEKKKFVVQNDYCMTLDLIPKKVKSKILDYIVSGDKEKEQLKEWKTLGIIDNLNTGKPKISKQKYMMLDTRYLTPELKNDLFTSIENLDEMCGNLLIYSENWQALQLLNESKKRKVKCIYIDPPYNTDASAIIYKNNYKNSSWLSLLKNGLISSKSLLTDNGIICVAVDDEEVSELRFVLQNLFKKQVGIVPVRSNPAGRKTKGKFAPAHEYALFYGIKDSSIPSALEKSEKSLARYPKKDEKGRFAWANFIRSGSNDKREDRPKLFYPIFVDNNDEIRIPKIEWVESNRKYRLMEKPTTTEVVVYPITKINGKVVEKNWQRGHIRFSSESGEYRVRRDQNGGVSIDFKTRMDEESLPITWWDHKKYASANHGAAVLKDLFGIKKFDFAKAPQLVMDCLKASGLNHENTLALDYFAGSGTTAEAVINLNRNDDGYRRYILVEMGQYFDTVTKPRIQKVVFTDNWKNGKPQDKKGISHCFQYMKLEQYEDTLNNIHFSENDKGKTKNLDFGDHIKYTLQNGTADSPSLLALDTFQKPFSYEMDIVELNERKTTNIDLVTTFNFLLGIKIKKVLTLKHQNRQYQIVLGKKGRQNHIIVWREFDKKLDLQKERDWILDQKKWFNNKAKLYCNVDNAFSANNIESEFKRLMFIDLAKV